MVYLFFMVAMNVLGIIAIPFFYEDADFYDVTNQIIGVFGLIGLYGFIKGIPIGSKNIWAAVLIIELLLIIGYGIYESVEIIKGTSELNYEDYWKFYIPANIVLILILLPYWYALFQYGFRSKDIWK